MIFYGENFSKQAILSHICYYLKNTQLFTYNLQKYTNICLFFLHIQCQLIRSLIQLCVGVGLGVSVCLFFSNSLFATGSSTILTLPKTIFF